MRFPVENPVLNEILARFLRRIILIRCTYFSDVGCARGVQASCMMPQKICFSPYVLSNFLFLEMKRSTGNHSREESQGGPDNVSLAHMYTYD